MGQDMDLDYICLRNVCAPQGIQGTLKKAELC